MNEARLLLGSGIEKRDGWKTLDADPARHCDFTATIPPLPEAVRVVQWEEIEWIHGISSLYPWEGRQVLSELHSALKPGGRLTLEQPDFRNAISAIEWVFGDPQFHNPLHMNRWGYTPDTLSECLQQAGFSKIAVLPAQHHVPSRDFRIEAIA